MLTVGLWSLSYPVEELLGLVTQILSEFGMREVFLLTMTYVTKHQIRVHLTRRVEMPSVVGQALRQQQLEVASHVISIVREQRWVSAGVQLSPFY